MHQVGVYHKVLACVCTYKRFEYSKTESTDSFVCKLLPFWGNSETFEDCPELVKLLVWAKLYSAQLQLRLISFL